MRPAAFGTIAVVAATLTGAVATWAALPVATAGGSGRTVVPAHYVHTMPMAGMPGMKMPMR